MMTLHAGHRQMTSGQRVTALFMFHKIITCGTKARNSMTAFTESAVGTIRKLSAMSVAMTIRTALMSQRVRHLAALVTFCTFHANMLSEQRITGFGVIKFLTDYLLLKALGRMTTCAIGAEFTFVRVDMTGYAVGKLDLIIFRIQPDALFLLNFSMRVLKHKRSERVTLVAGCLDMLAGQRVFRPGVIESACRLPRFL